MNNIKHEMILSIDDYGTDHPNGLGVTFNHVVWQMLRHRGHRYHVNITKPNNPYREAGRGENIWDYYFSQPAPDEPTTPAPVEDPLDLAFSGHRAWDIAHQRAISPFAREHIRLRPEIQAEVDSFKAQHFKGRVLAVAARGTDKETEYQPMKPSDMIHRIAEAKARLRCDTLFLMTDSAIYHGQITKALGAVSLDIPRSNLSLHHNPPRGPYWSGRWMVIDAWLAAAADAFLYTPSNAATIPLLIGDHEEIGLLNKHCAIEGFCQRVDRVLGIGKTGA